MNGEPDVIISHTRRFVFVHVPKTGGQSVQRSLLRYARFSEQMAYRRPTRAVVYCVGKVLTGRSTASWLTGVDIHDYAHDIREYLGRELYDTYFSFAFVRNPWDWVVSRYTYIHGLPAHRDHDRVRRDSFAAYVRREIEGGAPNQYDYVADPGSARLLVDELGRLENLEADFASMCRRIGLPPMRLPHLNRSSRTRDYRTYFDDGLAELVGSHYQRDVESFGYRF